MTEQKPPSKSWESWIEEQIREAQESGAFDNLEGAGKPLTDLGSEYDPDWWVKKLTRREQISDLPPALALRAKVHKALQQLASLRDENAVRRAVEALNAEIRKVNATVAEGPPTSLAPLDVDEVVREWHQRR
jgi:TnpA family transposase